MSLKKIISTSLAAAFTFIAAIQAYSLPGLPVSDSAGEYAYYQDFTFSTESIVGFLYYDESTYAVRYYSPASADTDEKDITIYLSVDPENSYMSFTGETIKGAYGMEDADIVNYLHDLMYEFSERRIKAEPFDTKASIQEDYLQFGGSVIMNFNDMVPVFNLESICKTDGSNLFVLETIGQLTSAEDDSFTTFKGVSGLPQDKVRSFKMPRRTRKTDAEFNGLKVKIDTGWTRTQESDSTGPLPIWFLGDAAALNFNQTKNIPEQYIDPYIHALERQYRKSHNGMYILWQHCQTVSAGSNTTLTLVSFDPVTGDAERTFISFYTNGTTLSVMTLTVFDGIYKANKSYFDNIVKSFSVSLSE